MKKCPKKGKKKHNFRTINKTIPKRKPHNYSGCMVPKNVASLITSRHHKKQRNTPKINPHCNNEIPINANSKHEIFEQNPQ